MASWPLPFDSEENQDGKSSGSTARSPSTQSSLDTIQGSVKVYKGAMGGTASKPQSQVPVMGPAVRGGGITDGGAKKLKSKKLPSDAVHSNPADYSTIVSSLNKLLLFGRLEGSVQTKVVSEMYEKKVRAGEILIKEGDKGSAARDLYVVKSGDFEVLQMRQGVQMTVNSKKAGDVFGEISLMYDCPRNATVAATVDAVVWVLERDTVPSPLCHLPLLPSFCPSRPSAPPPLLLRLISFCLPCPLLVFAHPPSLSFILQRQWASACAGESFAKRGNEGHNAGQILMTVEFGWKVREAWKCCKE